MPFLLITLLLGRAAYAEPESERLIGAPVFAADRVRVGRVADVSTTDEGDIDEIRVLTGSSLGLGERVVAFPRSVFVIRRRTILLPDLSASDVEALPKAASESASRPARER